MAGVATGLALTACSDDFLEVVNPTGEPLEDYYTTDAHIQEALIAAYDPIHWPDWGLGQYNALNIDAEIMGDLFWVGGENLDDMRNWHMLSNFQADENNTLSSLWTVDYSGIKRCNDLLFYLSNYNLKDITEENKILYEMQGRALRAFYYNMLWHYFGNIPYYTTNLTKPYTAPQLSADEVYNNVISELEVVADAKVLPMRWDDKNSGRVSQAMVYMMFAEMAMYQNDEARYSKALDYMNEIIASGKYALNPDFGGIWSEPGEWCSESIWEINYEDNNNERGWNSPLAVGGTVMPTLIAPNSWQGGDGFNKGADGWGFLPMRISTYNMYEEGDTRRDATCWDVRYVYKVDKKDYNARYQDTHIWLKKYRPQADNNAGAGFDNNLNYNNNLRYYRYAECLLNAAELMVRTGKGDAAAPLNAVRNRAGLGNTTATIDNIINERKLEFVGEGKRYWDLVRTGLAESVLVPTECDGTNPNDQGRVGTWTPNKKYIPIAQGELDSDPALKQNKY